MSLVVGFDLDLTLVDSAEGITAVFVQAGRDVGVEIDPADVRPLIGPPLDQSVLAFVGPDRAADLVRRYRELYPELGVPGSKLMPGAAESVGAVRARGGRSVVVSAKIESAIRQTLDHVGLEVDAVVGERFAETKGEALLEHGASVYAGDHPADMRGARFAGAAAVGITTGSHDAVALNEAGADAVLADLLDFPFWLDDHLAAA